VGKTSYQKPSSAYSMQQASYAAMELADYNIRVNAAPAVVNTTLYGVFLEKKKPKKALEGFDFHPIGNLDLLMK
jgi:NAD(P)-dependent dehydrogenase (short-subunit alcohol dehydrogenase family)